MNDYPFSVFKRADRSCYSVSFKDSSGKYLRPVSTGKKTEKEAMDMAFIWLRDGIPQKEVAIRVSDLPLKDTVRKTVYLHIFLDFFYVFLNIMVHLHIFLGIF